MQMDFINTLFQSEAGLSMRFWCKVAQGLAGILVSLAPAKTETKPKLVQSDDTVEVRQSKD